MRSCFSLRLPSPLEKARRLCYTEKTDSSFLKKHTKANGVCMSQTYLARLRSGQALSLREQALMILQLSLPAMLAQVSSIVMQYIDASMVGRLGTRDSAAIGLVASSTWLLGGLCSSGVVGFSVQVAQEIGAGEEKAARAILKHGFLFTLALSCTLAALGAGVSGALPAWLGGEEAIRANTTAYFLIFSLALPLSQVNNLSGALLQASGNMRLPSLLHVMMCCLDVVFNLFLIFPGRQLGPIYLPGAGLGVTGAALGTALAQAVTGVVMTAMLLFRSPALHLRRGEKFAYRPVYIKRGFRIALPVAAENFILAGAQILSTRIVAPLGTVAIAANSFGITAESLCYMPGYGIGNAATTLIGQSTGAQRDDLTRHLGYLCTGLGVAVMTITGVLMFIFAPYMIAILSPDPAVIALGTTILRIEAFAEPLYGASIVASGVFRGTGDTLVPSCLNFGSMWLVRLPLSALLAGRYGLVGVWVAMCIELCVRGILFLWRLKGKRWQLPALRGTI